MVTRKKTPRQLTIEPIYERQVYESTKAYHAFTIYRDLGVDRNCQKVADVLQCHLHNIQAWCLEWHWQQRTFDWDVFEEKNARKIKQKAKQDAIRKEYEQLAKSQKQLAAAITTGVARLTVVLNQELADVDLSETDPVKLALMLKMMAETSSKIGDIWSKGLGVEQLASVLEAMPIVDTEINVESSTVIDDDAL